MKDIDTGRAVLGCQGVASAEACLDPGLRRGDGERKQPVSAISTSSHVMAKPCSTWTGEAMLRMDGRYPDASQKWLKKNGPVTGAKSFGRSIEVTRGHGREERSLAARGRHRSAPDQAARFSGFAQST